MYKDFNYEKFTNYDEIKNATPYIVKPNDSLYSISNKYDVSVNELINLNKLVSTMIYPNQVLFIPTKGTNKIKKEYITKEGETLRQVRDKLGTNFDLDDLKIVSNQVLKYGSSKKEIIVDSNTTINSLLTTYNLTPLELLKLNEHLFLKVGTKITIK